MSISPGFDVCVIGAGISGAAFAHYAQRQGLRVCVLERDTAPGGRMASIAVGSESGAPGWLELGAHTCYNSYLNFLGLLDDLHCLDRTKVRTKLPFKMVTGDKIQGIPGLLSYPELMVRLPRLAFLRKDQCSVEDYYTRCLGPGNTKSVILPMLNAVASQDTSEFPADSLLKRRRSRRKDVPRSFAMADGMQSVVRTLVEQPRIATNLKTEVAAIEGETDQIRITTADRQQLTCRYVAIATPASDAAILLRHVLPEASQMLQAIQTRRIRSVGIVTSKPLPTVPRVAGLIFQLARCFSAVSADTFTYPERRAFTFHFQDDTHSLQDDVDFACRLLQLNPKDIATVEVKPNVMPALRLGYERTVSSVDRILANSRVFLVGNYLGGLSIEDCVSRAKAEAARLLRTHSS